MLTARTSRFSVHKERVGGDLLVALGASHSQTGSASSAGAPTRHWAWAKRYSRVHEDASQPPSNFFSESRKNTVYLVGGGNLGMREGGAVLQPVSPRASHSPAASSSFSVTFSNL